MVELAVGWYIYSTNAPMVIKFAYWFMITGLLMKTFFLNREADK
jgi:hypothetical protein